MSMISNFDRWLRTSESLSFARHGKHIEISVTVDTSRTMLQTRPTDSSLTVGESIIFSRLEQRKPWKSFSFVGI
jgi:hypothetical protein